MNHETLTSFIRPILVLSVVLFFEFQAGAESPPVKIGWHKALYDAAGNLLPWTSWDDAIDRKMTWCLEHPLNAHGYPDPFPMGLLKPDHDTGGNLVVPGAWCGMEIIAYLKYYEYTGKSNHPLVERAVQVGHYLMEQTLTPNEGAYPSFIRSTGYANEFPLHRSSQGDADFGENVIEPDKGGIAGYALLWLYRITSEKDFLDQAIHHATVLVNNMREGDAQHAPWPFRVDSLTGKHWGERNGNMVFILRLLDELIALGNEEYRGPREKLWKWVSTYQLCAPDDQHTNHWIQFFEDSTDEDSRTSWAPLEMARYLIERKEALDPQWKIHAEKCICFALRYFSSPRPGGACIIYEQDNDRLNWGRTSSKLGGVAAMFYAATGAEQYKDMARKNLDWMIYFLHDEGVPLDTAEASDAASCGSQDDLNAESIVDFVDAMLAVPEWSDGPRGMNAQPQTIGFHEAKYDADGKLLPWMPWNDVIDREMEWYLNCPLDSHGYPVFVFTTFMDGAYQPYKTDIIPCTQDGMGILSYLKYWEYKGRSNPKVLEWARKMGDYLVKETLTPDEGAYPRFTRSTGINTEFPLQQSSQGDAKYGPNVIEPDKGGLAGYALVKLYDATRERIYLDQAVNNAAVLARNMRPGSADQAPWPFRVDAITGRHWGERNGNMVFILRLFDELIARDRKEYQAPRDALWVWIKTFQIPSPDSRAENLWVDFFEDQVRPDNRTSWAPLEMARYLIEKKDALDPDWKEHAARLMQFSLRHFSTWQAGGVITMAEQDIDMRSWGGACAKLGGVAAMFYAAGGDDQYKDIAFRNLTWMLYHVDVDGCPSHLTGHYGPLKRGGWQEDCHTDVIHNFMDAIAAVPEWGRI